MTGNMKIGVALVGGYLLGRTKKAKMAIGFGMFLAGKKLSFDPKQLGKLVANSPVLGTLNDQVRKELVGATKSAATNALTQRASGLADSLHRRTLDLEDPGPDDGRDGKETRADDREYEDDRERDEDTEEREPEKKPAARRKTAAKAPAKSAAGSKSKSTSGARSASGGARKKTASGARKTASSTARKERGGRNG